MDQFYAWLGPRKTGRLRLAVMDMWKPFRLSTAHHAPQASILFDKFHVLRHLGDALDQVRKREYARVSGRQRRFIKGQKYTLLAHGENLTLDGRRALKTLLAANKRRHTAYLLKESFGQLWDYGREGWARRFFEHWRAALKWQRLEPYEKFAAMMTGTGMGSRPIAARRTRSRSGSSRASTTRSACSSVARTGSATRSTFASRSSLACCRRSNRAVILNVLKITHTT